MKIRSRMPFWHFFGDTSEDNLAHYEVHVNKESEGSRLDMAFVDAQIGLSRRKIRLAIDAGGVFVNKKRIRVSSRKVRAGDRLTLEYNPHLKKELSETFGLRSRDFIHIGPDFILLNKPPGLASQATKSQSVVHVQTSVEKYLTAMGERRKPILVHRLDRDTSGVMILALNQRKADFLGEQFRDRSVKKTYHALCLGRVKGDFCIKNNLSRPDERGNVRSVTSGGRASETRVKPIRVFGKLSLVECFPRTGRTHQIRVHLCERGYPIIGDKRYGGSRHLEFSEAYPQLSISHHLLHARELTVVTDRGRPPRTFKAPYPSSFESLLSDP